MSMRFHKITYPDVNNGLGCRATLWISGCSHHCEGCHNRETWSFKSGKEFTQEYEDKLFDIISLPYMKGLTLSGGDPLDSFEDVIRLLKKFREKFGNTKDVWLYTGYTMKDIYGDKFKEILNYVDFIVDGKFELEKKDITIAFRGSTNQVIYEKCGNHFLRSELNQE